MPLKVAAFYQFAALPDFRELREPLRAICTGLGLKGSVLLAQEGINGTVAGPAGGIDGLVIELQRGELIKGGDLEWHGDRLSGRQGPGNPAKSASTPCVCRAASVVKSLAYQPLPCPG